MVKQYLSQLEEAGNRVFGERSARQCDFRAIDMKVKIRPEYALALSNYKSRDDFWLFDEPQFGRLEKALKEYARRESSV